MFIAISLNHEDLRNLIVFLKNLLPFYTDYLKVRQIDSGITVEEMIAIENDVSVEEMIAMKNDISVEEVKMFFFQLTFLLILTGSVACQVDEIKETMTMEEILEEKPEISVAEVIAIKKDMSVEEMVAMKNEVRSSPRRTLTLATCFRMIALLAGACAGHLGDQGQADHE